MTATRRLGAMFAADVVGFSGMTGLNETCALLALRAVWDHNLQRSPFQRLQNVACCTEGLAKAGLGD